jgi:DNA excision repair protein ERCC-3
MNPYKIRYCYYLIKFHEARGDQVIVFFDDLISIEKYAEILKCDVIVGATKEQDRMRLLSAFRQRTIRVICVSSVGDTSIDLPDASVGIQVSSIFGGRRKETQRIGRILRPKSECSVSYFYSIVSSDTREVKNSAKRQEFLADQGFSYKIIPFISDIESRTADLVLDEHDLLRKTILLASQRLSIGDSFSSSSAASLRSQREMEEDEVDEEEEEERFFQSTQSRMLSSNISGGSAYEYFERPSQG